MAPLKKWYKIVDLDGKDVKTLFHSNKGSRILPIHKWIEADQKTVRDGSRDSSKLYNSGFHIMPNYEYTKNFLLRRFKNLENKAIVLCRAKTIWKKEHSPFNISLARWICIDKLIWRYSDSDKGNRG